MKIITETKPILRPNLTIEFTPEELDVLFYITGKVSGDQSSGRAVTDKLRKLLVGEGYTSTNSPYRSMTHNGRATEKIHFSK